MSEEVQGLKDLVQQLQAENEHLQRVHAPTQPSTSGSTARTEGHLVNTVAERLLYIPRERRSPVFRGIFVIGVDEWLEEVKASVRA